MILYRLAVTKRLTTLSTATANGVASCILTFALSGAFPDGVDPSCGSDHRLRVNWQFGSYQLNKPLSFRSGNTFVMGADRQGEMRIMKRLPTPLFPSN